MTASAPLTNPKPEQDVWTLPEVVAANLHRQPAGPALFDLLRRLDSPFIKAATGQIPKGAAAAQFANDFALQCEVVFILTRPASELRALLTKGRQQFQEAAMIAVGDLPLPTFLLLASAAINHLADAFLTQGQNTFPSTPSTFQRN